SPTSGQHRFGYLRLAAGMGRRHLWIPDARIGVPPDLGVRFLRSASEGARFPRFPIVRGDHDQHEPVHNDSSTRARYLRKPPRPHILKDGVTKTTTPAVGKEARSYSAATAAPTDKQARSPDAAVPAARVVRFRSAHYVFLSNELDTLRAMRAFLVGLK